MKRLLLAAALTAAVSTGLVADEAAEVYRMIYFQSDGIAQKLAAAQSLASLEDRSTAPVFAEALAELMKTQNTYRESTDKELFGRAVRVMAQALGEYKHEDAASSLWDVVENVQDPLARAEALIALGRMRAFDYAERISLLLRNLNLTPTPDKDAGEKVAFGSIVALEKLKDIRGFSPVFYASDSWYTLRVRQQAERSLPNIVADPTDPIKELISLETPVRKLAALKLNGISKATIERKTEAALLAMQIGHRQIAKDRTEARDYAELRKLALRSLVAYKAKGEVAVQGCKDSYESGFDDEERLLALQALGANGSDQAAEALRDIILRLNSDVNKGIVDETRNRMAKAAVDNAGLARNRILRPALVAVASNNKWSGSVMAAAQNALKQMP